MLLRRPSLPKGVTKWLGAIIATTLLLGGLAAFGEITETHYPIKHWLFWRYLGYWAASLLWLGACLSSGHALLRTLLGRKTLPVLEHAALAFAVGVVLFSLAVFVVGLSGQLNATAFFTIPVVLLASGTPASWRYLRRLRRGLKRSTGGAFAKLSLLDAVAMVFGLISLGLIYFAIITPKNIAFDAQWKHMALAQHYAAADGIERFPEGWFPASAPQLASRIYTWALLLPSSRFFDRVELAAHLEFIGFVFSLVGIPALVRRLVPHSRATMTWVTRFLFPGVFLYDSALGCGADHVAAFFTAPIFLALLRAYPKLCWRHCVLLAFPIAGVIMTKYSAAFALMLFPVLAMVLRALWLAVVALFRRLRSKTAAATSAPATNGAGTEAKLAWLIGPAACVLAGLLLTSPLWLKNLLWYGDPLYPLLHKYLPSRPWDADAAWLYEHSYRAQHWKPKSNLEGLEASLRALYNFSFKPNDWPKFHGKVPVFGSLFTLSLLTLPVLGKRLRLWALVAAVHLGILAWYWTHHQDRYLQVLLPWMCASTAAIMVLLWRRGPLVRGALCLLIGFQVAWGSDVPFIPGHAMVRTPGKVSAALIAMGYKRRYEKRFAVFGHQAVAAKLPAKARVLLHEQHPHLGLDREAVHDWVSWQAGINYGRLGSPHRVDELLRKLGVSHVVYSTSKSKGYDTIASDLLFFHYAENFLENRQSASGRKIATLPKQPLTAAAPFNDWVLFLPCSKRYAGLLRLSDMNVPSFGPGRFKFPKPREPLGDKNDLLAKAARAGFAVVKRRCGKRYASPGAALRDFKTKVIRKRFELYIRR